MPERPGRGGRRADPRPRVPDGLAAASRGLGRRTRHGPARRRPAADGRALRPRCAGHPAHRHPCLPTLTPGRPGPPRDGTDAAAHVASVRRAHRGRGRSAAGCSRSCVRGLDRARRRHPRASSRRSSASRWCCIGLLLFAAYYALMRSRVSATDDGADGGQRLPHPAATSGRRSSASLRRGAPWGTLDLSDGTTVSVMGVQGSDGARARRAVREIRAAIAANTPTEPENPVPRRAGGTLRSPRARLQRPDPRPATTRRRSTS